MVKEILFATDNNYKKVRFQAYFDSLGLSLLTFSDLREKIEISEDGKTAEENAVKKALAGFKLTKMPTFGVDYWLTIKGLSSDLQPGPFVRRIFKDKTGTRKEATDEEMLDYYEKIIEGLGGRTVGKWTSAIALVVNKTKIFSESFERENIFTSKRASKLTPGEPLNSLQIDPGSGKYLCDLTKEEWVELQSGNEEKYIDFMKRHLKDFHFKNYKS